MNETDVDRLCRAVLYEGYLLYPYRPSRKDRQRWNFGCVYPRSSGIREAGRDGWRLGAQCVVRGEGETRLAARVRFLRQETVTVPGVPEAAWEDATEQEFAAQATLGELAETLRRPFPLPSVRRRDDPAPGAPGRMLLRESAPIEGALTMKAEAVGGRLWKLTVEITNETTGAAAERDAALPQTMLSTHALLTVENGAFVSSIDPPGDCAQAVADCRGGGLWPVLVGGEGSHDVMLCAPIILYDYPRVAPQSPGDYFDGTEIDEMLTLRVLTLSDEEKQALGAGNPRGVDLLRRAEQLTRQELSSLHGTMDPAATRAMESIGGPPGLQSVRVGGVEIRRGDKVRLRPRRQADAFDILLTGEVATVESIEQDFEDQIHVAVTIDADPGRELGQARQIAHRFFYGADEIEPLAPRQAEGR